jgi:hypothetical protein
MVIKQGVQRCQRLVPTLALTSVFATLNYCLGGLPAKNSFESLLYRLYFLLNHFGIESILKQCRRLFKCFVVLLLEA